MDVKASLLMVGDELLIGQVTDTNASWIAAELWRLGIPVLKKITVSDTLDDIKYGLEASLESADLVIMTGGLGPTKDDITKQALADFFDDELIFHEKTFERIQGYFQDLGRPWNELHRLQCFLPTRAQLLTNELGTAPGMLFREKGRVVVSLPGVPYEMTGIFKRELLPIIRQMVPEKHRHSLTIRTIGIGESDLAEKLETLPSGWDQDVSVAYLPAIGQVRLRLSAKADREAEAIKRVDRAAEMVEKVLAPWIFGRDDESLEMLVGKLLRERRLTVGTAESCTAGLLAHTIATVPGASDYFTGSVVAYSNDIKHRILAVPAEVLERYGAVSEQTVKAMVAGAIDALQVDMAVAISGIAGPGGGTPDKPVGTIWLACGNKDRVTTKLLKLNKDRQRNIEYTVTVGLNMIRKFLMGL